LQTPVVVVVMVVVIGGPGVVDGPVVVGGEGPRGSTFKNSFGEGGLCGILAIVPAVLVFPKPSMTLSTVQCGFSPRRRAAAPAT